MQWLFSEQELRSTPSAKDGMSNSEEMLARSKGCSFIIAVGIQLRLPQICLATACTFLHRFYMRNSLRKYHYYDTGATCVFLAAKVEESGRHLRDIVVCCAKIASKGKLQQIDEQSKEFWRWRDTIIFHEELLLETLCFDFMVEHPYAQLHSLITAAAPNNKELVRFACGFVNASVRTPICLQYSAHEIAAAAFLHASEQLEQPDLIAEGSNWASQYSDVSQITIDNILITMKDANEKYRHHEFKPPES